MVTNNRSLNCGLPVDGQQGVILQVHNGELAQSSGFYIAATIPLKSQILFLGSKITLN